LPPKVDRLPQTKAEACQRSLPHFYIGPAKQAVHVTSPERHPDFITLASVCHNENAVFAGRKHKSFRLAIGEAAKRLIIDPDSELPSLVGELTFAVNDNLRGNEPSLLSVREFEQALQVRVAVRNLATVCFSQGYLIKIGLRNRGRLPISDTVHIADYARVDFSIQD
jgi:hypothetical protein